MLTPGRQAAIDPVEFGSGFMMNICSAYFGVRPHEILPETMLSVAAWLQGKNITEQDIAAAYSDTIIEKKPYLLLSRDEILAPIRKHYNQKLALIREIKNAEQETIRLKKEKAESDKHTREAIELFIQCWTNKEWTGTEFQAKIIRNLEQFTMIDTRVGKLLWKVSVAEEWRKRQADEKMPLKALINNMIPAGKEFIFSQKWATYICKNQVPIEIYEHESCR